MPCTTQSSEKEEAAVERADTREEIPCMPCITRSSEKQEASRFWLGDVVQLRRAPCHRTRMPQDVPT